MFKSLHPFLFPGKKQPRWRRLALAPSLWLAAIGLGVFVAAGFYFNARAITFPFSKLDDLPQRTLVFDRAGKPLGHISGHGENRLVISIDEVSPNFIKALMAREDARFYEHGGVDYRGVARAALRNLVSGDFEQGASTLTMQLARNTWGLKQKTLARKFQEVALAYRLERKLTKDQILEHYMNRVYFGSGLYGIERAAQGYFMKPATELTLGESAMLAGVVRGPSLLNPFRSLDNATGTRDEVLARLVAEGIIAEDEAARARKEPMKLRPPGERMATGSYVLQAIHDLLGDVLSGEDIAEGGLRIFTTIDQDMQQAALRALDGHLTKIENQPGFPHPSRASHQGADERSTEYVQGAVVSIENSSGAILSMVGGRNFDESPFNRALQARRQGGSTFKPFVYAVAFDRGGLMPGTWISDDPVRIDLGNGQVWSPSNSDGQSLGNQPAAVGLIRSRNTMTVRIGEIAGLANVRELARALKFGDIPGSPVSFLGAFETTPMKMTSAFSMLGGGGVNRAPYLIERIENVDGETLFRNEVREGRVFRESVAWLTSDVLGKVIEQGTGAGVRRLGYDRPCRGKTGTTNDFRDAWFAGFTDKVTTGVWIGMDNSKTIMDRGYGSTLALPVWVEVMKQAEKSGFPAASFPAPANLREVTLCRACGGIAQQRSLDPYTMGLPEDLWPPYRCAGHGTGGLFDLFSRRGGEDREHSYRDRDEKAGRGLGGAVRDLGRFIFGPSR